MRASLPRSGPAIVRRLRTAAATLLLVAVAGLFAVAAVYTSVLIVERQKALQQVARYNTTWLASQAVVELERLQQRIAAYALPGSGFDREEVQLRLDILANRVQLLRGGDVQELTAESPELQAVVSGLAAAVDAAQPMVDALAGAESARELMDLFAPLGPGLARLAAAANVRGGDRVAEDQQHLSRLHWTFSGILMLLAACGMGLFGVLLWHNRLLRRVHGELLARTAELHVQNKRFDAALNNMSQALCMADADQRLIVCNRPYLELFSLPPGSAKPGLAMRDVQRAVTWIGRWPEELVEGIHGHQREVARRGGRASFSHALGDGRALAVSHQPMADGGWVATYEDITERQRAEAKIAHMARHDALTGLANRTLLRERAEQALERLGRGEGGAFAVLCLDLDRFKWVNDTLGHPTGDSLLQAVAQRLGGCLREADLAARLGGDEFAILQAAGDQPGSAAALAERLVDLIGTPYNIGGHRIVIGVSVGVALAPCDGADLSRLLRNADLALYRAKSGGRGTFRLFEPEMETHLLAQRALQADLRKALGGYQLEMFYQPQVDVITGRTNGFEALLRWEHPEHGFLSPAKFIPMAEETGLIVPIGEWALRQACLDAARWPDHMTVAVNLSPLQFKAPDLVRTISDALAEAGLPPSRLELEITESVLLEDDEAVLATLHELRGLGLRVSLDDFGTGYSSLSYLRKFPFDKIKIDQSFVREMVTRPDCEAIVNSIIGLASDLGMTTIAEGVESAAQLSWLRRAGCTEAQGYHFSRPKPAAEVLADLGLVPDQREMAPTT